MSLPPDILDALRQALDKDPENGPLWAHYAQMRLQHEAGSSAPSAETADALRRAVDLGSGGSPIALDLVRALRKRNELAEAIVRVEKLLEDSPDPYLRVEHARILHSRGEREDAIQAYRNALADDPAVADAELEAALGQGTEASPRVVEAAPSQSEKQRAPTSEAPAQPSSGKPMSASHTPDPDGAEEAANHLAWGDIFTTFKDVAGLEEVKDQIRLRVIAPFENEKVFQAFGRTAGGGLLLYGPPGCGKTFIARATAGEIGARFVSIGINEVLDRWIGESEKLIHALFDQARANAPTVLFFDEFDALGGARGVGDNQFFRTVVDQLLQEMDGIGGSNEGVLVFAATNLPWHIDAAFRRPGRFDRVIFVPPPDEEARRKILNTHIEPLPTDGSVDATALARRTELYTGADLKAFCERASERALSESLRQQQVVPVTQSDFDGVLDVVRSTAEEWIATARNHAKYSNQGGRYDDVIRYLKSIGKW